MIGCVLTVVTATAVAAPASTGPVDDSVALWVGEPIAINPVDTAILERVGLEIREALAAAIPGRILYGSELLLVRNRANATSIRSRLASARDLLKEGEDNYISFNFAPAAASLAEAAGLFAVSLAELESEDVERLYRARLLEGISWLEAGHPESARAAFTKLITLRPDFEPDPQFMPPHAREHYKKALAAIRAAGVGAIEVRSEPPGATVFVDGLPRGKSPINVSALPHGTHGVRVVLPGYDTHTAAVQITGPRPILHNVRLSLGPALAALRRVEQVASSGQSPTLVAGDLSLLVAHTEAEGLVLIGAARREANLLISVYRWSPTQRSAVVVVTSLDNPIIDAPRVASLLLAGTWPSAQLTQGSAPVAVDFSRALLGIGPNWGGTIIEAPSIIGTWWFWTGVGVVIAGAAAGIVVGTRSTPEHPSDRVVFQLDF